MPENRIVGKSLASLAIPNNWGHIDMADRHGRTVYASGSFGMGAPELVSHFRFQGLVLKGVWAYHDAWYLLFMRLFESFIYIEILRFLGMSFAWLLYAPHRVNGSPFN